METSFQSWESKDAGQVYGGAPGQEQVAPPLKAAGLEAELGSGWH